MKTFFSIMAFVLLMAGQSWASGCLGGGWYVTERKDLPDAEILTDFYGAPQVEIESRQNVARIILENVGTTSEKLSFYSGYFNIEKDNVQSFIREFTSKKVRRARVHQSIETNPYYDDCEDIPENSSRTITEYRFAVILPDGQYQIFSSTVMKTNPAQE